jgi:hypothetical protein
MALSEDEKAAMCAETHQAAIALLDDLEFMREAISKDAPSRTDVRRISPALRRVLIEPHLLAVASPRIGRLQIPVADHRSAFETIDAQFLSVGFAPIYLGKRPNWHLPPGHSRQFFRVFPAR